MKSIPPKLRKNNKKEYVGGGKVGERGRELFFRLELIVFYLFQCFLVVLAYLSHEDRVLRQPSYSLEPYTKANLVKGPSYGKGKSKHRRTPPSFFPLHSLFFSSTSFFITRVQQANCAKRCSSCFRFFFVTSKTKWRIKLTKIYSNLCLFVYYD